MLLIAKVDKKIKITNSLFIKMNRPPCSPFRLQGSCYDVRKSSERG